MEGDEFPGYCSVHVEISRKYGWTYEPFRFIGCRDCARPEGFDLRGLPHLYGPLRGAGDA